MYLILFMKVNGLRLLAIMDQEIDIARLMNGLLFPQTGTVRIFGETLNEQNLWDIRYQMGMVFQNPDNQFVGATVQDDVAFALENNGIPLRKW